MRFCVSITILILWRVEHVFEGFPFRICVYIDVAALIGSDAVCLFGEFHCGSDSLIL
jgi:hypothetical protein